MPQAIATMKARGGKIDYVSKHDLNLVTDNKPHQVQNPHFGSLPMPLTFSRSWIVVYQ